MSDAALPLAATTFGFLYRTSLNDALREIAEAGYRRVELAAGPPHLPVGELGPAERRLVSQQLQGHGLQCVATNPLELNPVTANADLYEVAYRQYRAAIELSSELGAPIVVVVAGRRSPLVPMPMGEANDLLRAQLERLLPVAERHGVTLALEAVPYGFIETAAAAAAFVDEFGFDGLRLTLDCANVFFAGADPVEDLRAAAHLVDIVHISDTSRARWTHGPVGSGDVDLEGVARTLVDLRFAGATVYELAEERDPVPRLQGDLERLWAWGWAPR